jgi:hypothetical protein
MTPITKTEDRTIRTRWTIGTVPGERGEVSLCVEVSTSWHKKPDYYTGGPDSATYESSINALDVSEGIQRMKFSLTGPYRGGRIERRLCTRFKQSDLEAAHADALTWVQANMSAPAVAPLFSRHSAL